MSKKRFERWNDHSCKVKDNQEGILLSWEDVVKKLNKQQSDLVYLARFIGEFKVDEFKEYLTERLNEKEEIIKEQERRIIVLENLLTNIGVKWVDDDE